MKVLIVASEFPYPANHGAKVDIWNRILAFEQINVEVFLIAWYPENDKPKKEHIEYVLRHVKELVIFPVLGVFRRIMKLINSPSQVAARTLKNTEYRKTLPHIIQFSPDFVFVDSIYGGATGLKIAQDLSLPISLRLHNVEHSYMWGQLKLAKTIKSKLALLSMNMHLKRYEYNLIEKADSFYDISISDLAYWRQQNFMHGYWLPPIIDATVNIPELSIVEKIYHVAFVGNLYTPNNVSGIFWFVKEVLPLIRKEIPNLKFAIVGSNPSAEIIKVCEKDEFIDLFPNVADTTEYIQKAMVLINPVRFSSGVNIKAINMLALQNQIVSTSDGIRGLPKGVSEAFFIADDSDEFSKHILDVLIKGKVADPDKRKELRNLFQVSALKNLLPKMLIRRNIK